MLRNGALEQALGLELAENLLKDLADMHDPPTTDGLVNLVAREADRTAGDVWPTGEDQER
jgi:hypothetical protein